MEGDVDSKFSCSDGFNAYRRDGSSEAYEAWEGSVVLYRQRVGLRARRRGWRCGRACGRSCGEFINELCGNDDYPHHSTPK